MCLSKIQDVGKSVKAKIGNAYMDRFVWTQNPGKVCCYSTTIRLTRVIFLGQHLHTISNQWAHFEASHICCISISQEFSENISEEEK